MKKLILAAMAAAMLFTAPTMASAEEPVDMSKLSCKEFLSADQSKIGMMLCEFSFQVQGFGATL